MNNNKKQKAKNKQKHHIVLLDAQRPDRKQIANPIGSSGYYGKLALYSIYVPLIISFIFFLVDVCGIKRSTPNELVFENLLTMLISYLVPTLISTSCFMILKQFFLLVLLLQSLTT